MTEGMPMEPVLNKYPYLRMPPGVSIVKCYRGVLSIYVIILDIVKVKAC